MGVFTFKQFSICDDGATMKVGTDAVLLGAWPVMDHVNSILDIGTGSGIVALMLAQRSNPEALIDAVELQVEDARQARANVLNSPWPEKINVTQSRIQDFFPPKKFDLIVCNPPYFSNSLLPPLDKRGAARHDRALTFDELITSSTRLLATSGKFCVILPLAESEAFTHIAASSNLYLQRLTRFFTRTKKLQERSLMQFGFAPEPVSDNSLILYASGNEWTKEYRELTQDFYLSW